MKYQALHFHYVNGTTGEEIDYSVTLPSLRCLSEMREHVDLSSDCNLEGPGEERETEHMAHLPAAQASPREGGEAQAQAH